MDTTKYLADFRLSSVSVPMIKMKSVEWYIGQKVRGTVPELNPEIGARFLSINPLVCQFGVAAIAGASKLQTTCFVKWL